MWRTRRTLSPCGRGWSRSDRVRGSTAASAPRIPSSAASQPPSPARGKGSLVVVGARLPRVDGRAKVDGTDLFGADCAPADALWMRVVRSPHAQRDLHARRSRRRRRRHARARRDPHRRRMCPAKTPSASFAHLQDQPVLAPGQVRFRGEAVLALVGTRDAVESVSDADLPIAWTPLPAAVRHRRRAGARRASPSMRTRRTTC